METVKLKFDGKTPLLMHNARLSDPLDPATMALKTLTDIKKKTQDIQWQVARAEWEGGLYFDEKIGPYLPTQNLRAAIIEAARMKKLGMNVTKGALILEEKAKLLYAGPRTLDGLWKEGRKFYDRRSVVNNGTSRVIRTRPRFENWSVEFELVLNTEVIQKDQIIEAAHTAGKIIGVGDYRVTCCGVFGRFDVTVLG